MARLIDFRPTADPNRCADAVMSRTGTTVSRCDLPEGHLEVGLLHEHTPQDGMFGTSYWGPMGHVRREPDRLPERYESGAWVLEPPEEPSPSEYARLRNQDWDSDWGLTRSGLEALEAVVSSAVADVRRVEAGS